MIIAEICNSNVSPKRRRQFVHKRKLEMMTIYRDALERRISALNASIETLEHQIERDEEKVD